MVNCSDSIGRLKHTLRVSKDGEVAAALGLSKTAFAERRRRGSFPEKELLALAAKHPELGIDTTYVLTGETAKEMAARWLANFPARLRNLRAGRSVGEFAALLQTTDEHVMQLEAGARVPSQVIVDRLQAMHPGRSVGWLISGESPVLQGPLEDVEVILIANYRASSKQGQEALRHQAAFFASQSGREPGGA